VRARKGPFREVEDGVDAHNNGFMLRAGACFAPGHASFRFAPLRTS
jgi:hypothetical protein